jgi:acetyltransferase
MIAGPSLYQRYPVNAPQPVSDSIDRWQGPDGAWLEMRRLRPSDEPLVKESLNNLSAISRRNRFFTSITEFSDQTVHQLVDVDPGRVYPLVVLELLDGIPTPIAGGRFVEEKNGTACSFSVLIGDPWQGQGIGRRIVEALLHEASRRGLRQMYGEVLCDNQPMLQFAHALHFVVLECDAGTGVVDIVRDIPDACSRHRHDLLGKLFRK